MSKTECYVKIKNKYEPINAIPAGIKCLVCQSYFPFEKIEEHFSIHIDPTHSNLHSFQVVEPVRLDLSGFDKEKESENIWVRSFLPAELPSTESKRKRVQKIRGEKINLSVNEILGNLSSNPDRRNDIYSRLAEDEENIEEQETIVLEKQIDLARRKQPIVKKQLHVYRNEKREEALIDRKTFGKRKPISSDLIDPEAETNYYEIKQRDLPRGSFFTPEKDNLKSKYNINTIRKLPHQKIRISTFPKSDSARKRQIDENTECQHFPIGIPIRGDHDHNHQCPCCKGFYCSVCKSSVPPIYRPVPDEEGRYHFHPDSEQNLRSIQFYRDHYYKRDNEVCTSCEKHFIQYQLYSNEKERLQDSRRTALNDASNKKQ